MHSLDVVLDRFESNQLNDLMVITYYMHPFVLTPFKISEAVLKVQDNET